VKRRLALLLALCGCLAVGASTASARSGLALTQAKSAGFPNRAFVISLPSDRALTAGDVQVTENGNPVVGVSLVPAAGAGKKAFGVVLVVDSSDSMAGRPIAAAMTAGQAFAARRSPNQQFALVTFNASPKVALPFTTSPANIGAALATPPQLAYGTQIYDAIGQGLDLLERAGIESGSIVLLSDGADTGSRTPQTAVLDRARLAHVRLFTVGLRSSKFDAKTLQSLAPAGGGAYAEASSPADLAPLFDKLGSELAREYLLQYKSLAGPEKQVDVNVHVAGAGAARTAYMTPALPIGPPAAPYHKSLATKIWTSIFAMILIALLCAGGLAYALSSVLRPGSSELRRRVSNFVTLSSTERVRGNAGRTMLTGVLDDAEGSLGRWRLWEQFEEEVAIAEIKMSPIRIVAAAVSGTIVLAILLVLVFGSVLVGALALFVPLFVRGWVKRKLRTKRKRFAEQLPDSLDMLASALRAGHSLVGALSVVVEGSPEPMKSELARVVADEQLGVPLEDALEVVVRRMDNKDLEQVALVAKLQRDMGGNAAEVIDRVTETVRERFELRRLINTLTAQGRMSRWIVSLLPVGLFLLISVLNRHYFHPLWSHQAGRVLVVLAVLMGLTGSWVIKRIVEIKV
jgi:tight adherence protein B